MPKILKKVEERMVGYIVYGENTNEPDYETFEIIRNTELSNHIVVKFHESWRTKKETVRYFEALLNIIKSEL